MAVVHEQFGTGGIDINENVESFLTARPSLKAQLPEILSSARRFFPTERIRVSVDHDPDDYSWESLLLEFIVADGLSSDFERLDAFVDACLMQVMCQFPSEVVAIISSK